MTIYSNVHAARTVVVPEHTHTHTHTHTIPTLSRSCCINFYPCGVGIVYHQDFSFNNGKEFNSTMEGSYILTLSLGEMMRFLQVMKLIIIQGYRCRLNQSKGCVFTHVFRPIMHPAQSRPFHLFLTDHTLAMLTNTRGLRLNAR